MTIEDAFALIHNAPAHSARTSNAASNPTQQPTTWADLGCGSGLFTRALARLLKSGSTIYGIDRAPGLQRQTTPNAVHLLPLTLDFVKEDLPLQNLDGILMANALHYVKDKPVLIKSLQDHLQPAAPFLIVEYDTDRPVTTWVPYPLSFLSLQKLFRTAGYGHIEKIGSRPSLFGRGDIYAAIIHLD